MKKVALILLIGIYAIAMMGFSLKQFYCCDQLKSTTFSLVQDVEKKCGKGSEKSGCCDNKYQFFRVKDAHISAGQADFFVKHFVDSRFYTSSFQDISFVSQKTTIANSSNAPPTHSGVPNYIYNCVFKV